MTIPTAFSAAVADRYRIERELGQGGMATAASHAGGTRLTETGLSVGTPRYMSPEQAMGDRELDAHTDIYSLACTLYEMLAEDPPFLGSTAQAIVAKIITERPPSVSVRRDTVPEHVSLAIQRALAKLPADRFQSDGSTLAYVAAAGGATRLFVRRLDGLEVREIPGTDGAYAPFFSPDGQWIDHRVHVPAQPARAGELGAALANDGAHA